MKKHPSNLTHLDKKILSLPGFVCLFGKKFQKKNLPNGGLTHGDQLKSKKISLNKSSVDLGGGEDFHPHSSHWMTEVGKYLSQDLHGSFMAAPLQPVVKNSRSQMRSNCVPLREKWRIGIGHVEKARVS